jgi:hydroxybutyrate-dimer hydrolase
MARSSSKRGIAALSIAALALGVASCGGGSTIPELEPRIVNALPNDIVSTPTTIVYDGNTNDLLTGGLGKAGLALATAPAFADVNNPTVEELRKRAIYTNYRALVDITDAGGFGRFYGPNIDSTGKDTLGEGKIAGEEWIALSSGTIGEPVTVMVQVPAKFDPANPCIIAAPSSGSRGIYGAIATAGEWGLKRGCAVTYTDKGTGNGAYDLSGGFVYSLRGLKSPAATLDARDRQFGAGVTTDDLAKYNSEFPNRWAFKHAHQGYNAESGWGTMVLQSIDFAFYVLNQKFGDPTDNGRRFRKFFANNTLVIASSVSNGGGASLSAIIGDGRGLIDGVAVAEPQIFPNTLSSVKITRGDKEITGVGKNIVDYTTYANLYQPCAASAPSLATAPGAAFVAATSATARCGALADKGLLDRASAVSLPDQALAKLRTFGWEADSDVLHASHYAFATPAIAVTYTTAIANARVNKNLCNFSFAATAADGTVTTASAANAAALFGNGNGIPPTAGINLINNASVGGARLDGASLSPRLTGTGVADFNFPGAFCLREVVEPVANATYSDEFKAYQTAYTGTQLSLLRSGNFGGRPVVIVHGRSDALVPVNHSSRPLVATSRSIEGANSKLSYIEVTNAQHFDAFIGNAALPGFDTRYVPLHVYFNQAMDAVWDNLKNGKALPPSQVVRTVPRGGTPGQAPALTAANVPAIAATPKNEDSIRFESDTLKIPE